MKKLETAYCHCERPKGAKQSQKQDCFVAAAPRNDSDRKRNTKAQVTLELGLSFVCMFLLLLGGVKLCTWCIGQMVQRQEDYEASDDVGRVTAGSTNMGAQVDESDYQELNLVK